MDIWMIPIAKRMILDKDKGHFWFDIVFTFRDPSKHDRPNMAKGLQYALHNLRKTHQ